MSEAQQANANQLPPEASAGTADVAMKTANSDEAAAVETRSDIWFDDGSVVLQAENTQFKVHRSFLEKHSEAFEAMFGIPYPDNEPRVEGCPIVELQDSVDDVRNMLLVLYDQGRYALEEALPFSMLSSMLRMGRKYSIKALRDQAVDRLTREYPSDENQGQYMLEDPPAKFVRREPNLLYKVLGLAYEYDIKTILPQAYLLCCFDYLPTLLADDAVACMPLAALRTCIVGREELYDVLSFHFRWFGTREGGDDDSDVWCSNPNNGCRDRGNELLTRLWRPKLDLRLIAKSWVDFQSEIQEKTGEWLHDVVCLDCVKAVEEAFERAQIFFWRGLPGHFGLPEWRNLKNFGGD